MVVREARDRAAEAIMAYMRGEIDNFALEKVLRVSSEDRGLGHVASAVWFVYDDLESHHRHGPPSVWDFLCRCIAYLKSDLEPPPARWKWLGLGRSAGIVLICIWIIAWVRSTPGHRLPFYITTWGSSAIFVAAAYLHGRIRRRRRRRRAAGQNGHEYYPFRSREHWETYEPLLEGLSIPAYDPDWWNVPIRSKAAEEMTKLGSLVALPLAMVAWAPLIALLFMLPSIEHRDD